MTNCPPPNITPIIRKIADRVTIVHLTDLHFPPLDGAAGRVPLNPDIARDRWSNLARDIASQNPDIICVTGDLADNPLSDVFRATPKLVNSIRRRFGMAQKTSGWDESLRLTFERVKEFLTLVCRQCKLDESRVLFVVPGNHDLRMQGVFAPRWSSEAAKRAFQSAFGSYPSNANICFIPATGTKLGAITVKLVGFDSNDESLIASFGSGYMSAEQRKRFEQFDALAADAKMLTPQVADFRVCLVHHHPLPVVAAERVTHGTGDGTLNDLIDGEQGMVFNNAGSFLHSARRNSVNLVLHGHRHNSQFTIVRYPLIQGEHSMFVAGGGSIGEVTDGRLTYNVVHLHSDTNVEVIERSRRASGMDEYAESMKARLYNDYATTRLSRRVWLLRRNLEARAAGDPAHQMFGIAQCERLHRELIISIDGSARIVIAMNGLSATSADSPVTKLPIAVAVQANAYVADRKLNYSTVSGNAVTPDFSRDSEDTSAWEISFTPALRSSDRLNLQYSMTIYNAFDFVEEYLHAREGELKSNESSTLRPLRVIFENMGQTIKFPVEWHCEPRPVFRVLDEWQADDPNEQGHHGVNFTYQSANRVASLTIDRPLPAFQYCVEWALQSKNEFEKRYVPALLNRSRVVAASTLTPESKSQLYQMLLDFRGSDPIMSSNTEIAIFVARSVEPGITPRRIVKSTLNRLVVTREFAGHICLEAGWGLAGLAHRSGEPRYYSRNADLTTNCSAYRSHAGKADFVTLWAIPVKIPNTVGHTSTTQSSGYGPREMGLATESPVFAVICLGCRSDDGSLDPRAEGAANLTERVVGEIGSALMDALDPR